MECSIEQLTLLIKDSSRDEEEQKLSKEVIFMILLVIKDKVEACAAENVFPIGCKETLLPAPLDWTKER